MDIPLHEPWITEKERRCVDDVLERGALKGGGKYDARCREILESAFDAPWATPTTSCTHALEMAAMVFDIGAGDEVVIPSYTFPSTATAFQRRGADISFCDVRPETMNLDPDHLETVVSARTAAIVPVHYAGTGCAMDRILDVAAKYDAVVIEDAAQAVNARYGDDYLGTMGDAGCFSFHGTKSYVAGEGGALILEDPDRIERAEIVRQKGTDYEQFRRGEVDRYKWVAEGSSYVPSELQTAVATAQLERHEEIRDARKETYEYYQRKLAPLAEEEHLRLPTVPDGRTSNYHLYFLRTEDAETRAKLCAALNDQGIGAAKHYEPLHQSPMGRQFLSPDRDLPTTEREAPRILRLPVHPGVSRHDRERVVDAIDEFFT